MNGAAATPLPRFFRLVALDTVDSTNGVAHALAAEGAPEGTLVWARTQTAGRGRRGRGWHSPPGNLFLSALLRPDALPGEAAQLSFAAALAVHDAAAEILPSGVRTDLKWPNDVLVEGRKVSGILLETAETPGEARPALVVGIGVNVAASPPDAAYPATCLADHGATADLATVLAAVARGIERWYGRWRDGGFGPLRAAWLARARGVGDPITVRLPDASLDGIFVDLDPSGALILDAVGGRRTIGAGDVFFRTGG